MSARLGTAIGLLLLVSALSAVARGALAADTPAGRAPAGIDSATGGPPSAARILDEVDDLFRGEASRGRATMTVRTTHWTRTLALEFWSKGKERSLIRILAPVKEKGTATLRAGNDLWNYLPKVKRVIKLPSSMMSASWMGSHFNNDDLVKESRMAEDYSSEITFAGVREGRDVIEITCVPKPDAAVVWGKVVVVVREEDHLPVVVRYYDEDLALAREMTYAEIATLGGRTLPTKLVMVPVDKPGEATTVVYDEMTFDEPLDETVFSLRALQQ